MNAMSLRGPMAHGAANWSARAAAGFCYSTPKRRPVSGMRYAERASRKCGGASISRAQPCSRRRKAELMDFIRQFLTEAAEILNRLDVESIERVTALLAETR